MSEAIEPQEETCEVSEEVVETETCFSFDLDPNQEIYRKGGKLEGRGIYCYFSMVDGAVDLVCPKPFKKVTGLYSLPDHIIIEDNPTRRQIVAYIEDNEVKDMRNYILWDAEKEREEWEKLERRLASVTKTDK